MKLFSVFICITLTFSRGFCQDDFIRWNKWVNIKWSDFKGKTDRKSPFAAMSAVGIYYKFNSVSKGQSYQVSFEIDARFDRTRSWSKQRWQTPNMLKHEQLHFDICELYSRKFKKEAENTVYTKNYRNEIARLFSRFTNDLQKLQQQYDLETKHSTDRVKQKKWEQRIRQQLLKE